MGGALVTRVGVAALSFLWIESRLILNVFSLDCATRRSTCGRSIRFGRTRSAARRAASRAEHASWRWTTGCSRKVPAPAKQTHGSTRASRDDASHHRCGPPPDKPPRIISSILFIYLIYFIRRGPPPMLGSGGRKVVLSCTGGPKSALAVEVLLEFGVDAVAVAGGITAWHTDGFEVVHVDDDDDDA